MKTALFFVLTFLLTGCKKAIEKIKEDLVVQAMIDGQWGVTNFTQNGNNITADFASYKFKYYSNKTVDAINNGTLEKTGTWDGSSGNMTTSANFPGASSPLNLINGSWHINNNSWTFVEAAQTNGSEIKTMRLDKL